MKKLLILGALTFGLAACGGQTQPAASYPYNPNQNPVQQNDPRTPYYGDWVFVAQLADGTKRYGVASISVKASSSTIVNAGGGVLGWCLTQTCTAFDEQGTAIIGTFKSGADSGLSVGMVPQGATTTRFVMVDDDGLVQPTNGKPTIAGNGVWTDAAGGDQNAVIALVQISVDPKIKAQGVTGARTLAQAQDWAQVALTNAALGGGRTLPASLPSEFAQVLRR